MSEQEKNAAEILDYLSRNPQAGDSFEGITNWWIAQDKGARSVVQLREALSLLIAEGKIEEVKIQKDVVLYQMKKKVQV